MGKSKKKKKANEKSRIVLVFFALFILVILLLISEIVGLNRNTKRDSKVETSSNDQNFSNDKNKEENVVKFESFLNEKFSMQELDNMNTNDLANIYKNSEGKEVIISNCTQLAGSAESKEGAIINAKNVFYSNNQFINSCKIINENEYYYVVEVNYTYIDPNVTNNYVQNVLVLKDAFYNDESEKFKQDIDYEDIKIILDLKYYLKFHLNGNMSLIQSYIRENSNECTYTIYYFVANYGQDNVNDTINLMKDIVHVNNKTGEVINKEEIEIRSKIRV